MHGHTQLQTPGPNDNDDPPRKKPKIAPVYAEQATLNSPTRKDVNANPDDYAPVTDIVLRDPPEHRLRGNVQLTTSTAPHPELPVLLNCSATTPGQNHFYNSLGAVRASSSGHGSRRTSCG